MNIDRAWAMPNHETFSIKPIRTWIKQFIDPIHLSGGWSGGGKGVLSIDPFARGSKMAMLTNDLNPDFSTDYHMDALDFLKKFDDDEVDLVLYDPPYSLRQLKECYNGLGAAMTQRESQHFFSDLKKEIARITKPGGTVLSFGWNTVGIGKTRGFEMVDVLLVCHGGIHNDTICVREIKK